MQQLHYLQAFNCLMEKCPDTCCSHWGITVTNKNKEYMQLHAPELIESIEPADDNEFQMRRTHEGECIHLCEGRCKVHQQYGEAMLPDICQSFPKNITAYQDDFLVTANLACPESLRLALASNSHNNFVQWDNITRQRTPEAVFKPALPFDEIKINPIDWYHAAQACINEAGTSPDEMISILLMALYPLTKWDAENHAWPDTRIFKIKSGEQLRAMLNSATYLNQEEETMNLLQLIYELIYGNRNRYFTLLQIVDEELGSPTDDPSHVHENYLRIKECWRKNEKTMEPFLKNWIHARLSVVLFPLGLTPSKWYPAMINIAMEYLAVKTILYARNQRIEGQWTLDLLVDTIQPLAKQFHLCEPKSCYEFGLKRGWNEPSKIISLVMNY